MYQKGQLMNWNNYLSTMTQTLPPSGIRKFWEKAMAMDDVISLCVGEPDYIPPQPVLDALVASVERGETNYSPMQASCHYARLLAIGITAVTMYTTARMK